METSSEVWAAVGLKFETQWRGMEGGGDPFKPPTLQHGPPLPRSPSADAAVSPLRGQTRPAAEGPTNPACSSHPRPRWGLSPCADMKTLSANASQRRLRVIPNGLNPRPSQTRNSHLNSLRRRRNMKVARPLTRVRRSTVKCLLERVDLFSGIRIIDTK